MLNERDRTRAKILGVLIRDARLHAGRSLEECAAALSVEVDLLEQYETATSLITLPQLEALAVFLEVPLAHFWGNKTLGDYPTTRFATFIAERRQAIGARIQALRQEENRSLEDLAAACDFPPEQLAAVEDGQAELSLFELERLAVALGRSLNAVIEEENPLLAHHEARQKQQQRFREMPDDMRNFVSEPVNQSYLEIAMRLSRMDVHELRAIAESILNITF